jgi:methyl coenzyme M reductase subunit D
MFEKFWSLISHKKGSKFLANKKYALNCSDMIPEEVATTFNRYASTVKDKEFLAHVSTWINQRRFEDDENNKTDIKSIIERLVALGYEHTGRVHNYEKFIKDGKKYKINRLDENNMIVPD